MAGGAMMDVMGTTMRVLDCQQGRIDWAMLRAKIVAAGHAELVVVATSTELEALRHPQAHELLAELRRDQSERIALVSMGCVSLFAAVLEVQRVQARRALILLLDGLDGLAQRQLDAAGMGSSGDGLRAQDCAALIEVASVQVGASGANRSAGSLGVDTGQGTSAIGHCVILAKPPGSGGTALLLQRLARFMGEASHADAGFVSFAIRSDWSDRLERGIAALLRAHGISRSLLASSEEDARHWLSAKPVLDLLVHGQQLAHRGLVLMCLGAGGRIGLMSLYKRSRVESNGALAARAMPLSLGSWPLAYSTLPQPELMPRYAQDAYKGVDGGYFLWELT